MVNNTTVIINNMRVCQGGKLSIKRKRARQFPKIPWKLCWH